MTSANPPTQISEPVSNEYIQAALLHGIESSHTTMTTRVHVPDQHFVVLSGMIQDTKTRYKSGIPCLGGLPVIGVIFSENDRQDAKANLIIFLRPHIVNTYEDYKEDHRRTRMHSIKIKPSCRFSKKNLMPASTSSKEQKTNNLFKKIRSSKTAKIRTHFGGVS